VENQVRILIIDDDPEMLELLEFTLTNKGFDILTTRDGRSGLRAAYEAHPDAILLDIMMPNLDGFETCRRLRDLTDAPILFITAKEKIEDIQRGFAAGADDYITKPFNRQELVSRLTACLRRAGVGSDETSDDVLVYNNTIILNHGRHKLLINGEVIHLTPTECAIMQLLLQHAGKVLSPNAILTEVWGPERIGDQEAVKQYIYRLRQKLEPYPHSPRYIHTVRSEGYYFDPPPTD
jgi:DNA-binding response OmpR family regulator